MTADRPENGRGPTARAVSAEASLIGVAGVGAVLATFTVSPGRLGVAGAALATLALAIAVVDRRRLIIPDELNALAFVAGLATAGLTDAAPREAVLHALLRASLMSAAFFAFRAGYRGLRGREGMGLGDVKLAAVAGVWLGWTDLPVAVDIAALYALAWALLGRLRGNEWSLAAKLPFGAFFAPAIWICWLLAAWRSS